MFWALRSTLVNKSFDSSTPYMRKEDCNSAAHAMPTVLKSAVKASKVSSYFTKSSAFLNTAIKLSMVDSVST